MHLTATISDLSRASVHDGPGVRTVVYFKGCSLSCLWCHNPEAILGGRTLLLSQTKCIGCGRCFATCPSHRSEGGVHIVDRASCTASGKCADACPTGALSLVGERVTVDELLARVLKDKPYYDVSGGGVTLSGGECLLQSEFCASFLAACHGQGVHTAIETALFVPYESVERVLPYTDLVFADLKLATPARHRAYTGQDNARILENLRRLSHENTALVVRIPVIPTVNDTEEEQSAIASVLRTLGDAVRKVELLRYNPLAEGKYRAVGRPYTAFAPEGQTDEEMSRLSSTLARAIDYRFPVEF